MSQDSPLRAVLGAALFVISQIMAFAPVSLLPSPWHLVTTGIVALCGGVLFADGTRK